MTPKAGDIYYFYNDRMAQYNACQVIRMMQSGVDGEQAAVLLLDWAGDQPPTPQACLEMRPLYPDFFFWSGEDPECYYVDANVPKGFQLACNQPPLLDSVAVNYGDWPGTYPMWRQTMWRNIPGDKRARFKESLHSAEPVTVGTHQYQLRYQGFAWDQMEEGVPFSDLAKLPCLTRLEWNSYPEELHTYLSDSPFIYELTLMGTGKKELDLRGTYLNRLILDGEGLEELWLNDSLETLEFTGPVSPDLRIHAYQQGRWLTMDLPGSVPLHTGMDNLYGIRLGGIRRLDLEPLVRAYPNLRSIRLWGNPGILQGLSHLGGCPCLEHFTLVDLFGFEGEEFPSPQQLPGLTWLWLSSLPADSAAHIKRMYREAAKKGLDFSVTRARGPQWMEENLDNPFRAWDGRDGITAISAQKVARQYRLTRQKLQNIAEQADAYTDNRDLHLDLENACLSMVSSIQEMNERKPFMGLIEQQEIVQVITCLAREYAHILAGRVDQNALLQRVSRIMEF